MIAEIHDQISLSEEENEVADEWIKFLEACDPAEFSSANADMTDFFQEVAQGMSKDRFIEWLQYFDGTYNPPKQMEEDVS